MRRLAILALMGVAGCYEPMAPAATPFAIVGATLVDGTGAAPRAGMTVVVEDGRIVQVASDATVTLSADMEQVDATGRWLMPGLVDTHTHLPGPDFQAPFLRTLLSFGVTTARSPAAAPASGVDARARLESGELIGPRFLTAGRLIDGTGSIWSFASIVDDEAEIRAEVDRQAAAGVDFIKLYVRLGPDVVAAGIDAAHAAGLPVIGHLGRTTWPQAVDDGIDHLTHSCYWGMAHSLVPRADSARFAEFFAPNGGFDIGDVADWAGAISVTDPRFADFASAAATGGVSIDPNLVLCEAVIWGTSQDVFDRLRPELDVQQPAFPHPYSPNWSTTERDAAKAAFPTFMQVISELHGAGVPLTVGSDTMNPWMTPGAAAVRELELLEAAGISAADVVVIATRNGAAALGVLSETGTIEVGKSADLLLLSADPTRSASNVRNLDLIVTEGRRFTPSELRGS